LCLVKEELLVKESCHINYIVTLTRAFEREALECGQAQTEQDDD